MKGNPKQGETAMTSSYHVSPLSDIREHVESEDCWCEPRIKGDRLPFLIVHHSADRRELTEQKLEAQR